MLPVTVSGCRSRVSVKLSGTDVRLETGHIESNTCRDSKTVNNREQYNRDTLK